MTDDSPSQLPAVATTVTTSVVAPPKEVELTASTVDEMQACQQALIQWTDERLNSTRQECSEMTEAYESAKKNKWKTDPLKRQVTRIQQRIEFYEKLKSALEHGYTIVPNFPVTAFAIRTDRDKPMRMATYNLWSRHTQSPPTLPEGEGDYKNPFPIVHETQIKPATATENEVKNYYAVAWKDLEFPINMAKTEIIEATSRAMALKIFDDIGILPGYAPGEGTKPPKQDPIIIARIFDKSRSGPYTKKWISFIVAWHLDTRTL